MLSDPEDRARCVLTMGQTMEQTGDYAAAAEEKCSSYRSVAVEAGASRKKVGKLSKLDVPRRAIMTQAAAASAPAPRARRQPTLAGDANSCGCRPASNSREMESLR